MEKNRRQFMKAGVGAMGTLMTITGFSKAVAATCGPTPPQTPGPFYPGESKFKPENDLTRLDGQSMRPVGQVIYVSGRVLNPNCQPVVGANVEIWQACASGRYNNDTDPNPAPLDPNFRYWGETLTDDQGSYMFKTIIPGAYPADTDWMRPPHIHFKISRLGFKELVTQMYFSSQKGLNDKDLILLDVPANERGSVIVDFKPAPEGLEPGSLAGEFDITLQPVR